MKKSSNLINDECWLDIEELEKIYPKPWCRLYYSNTGVINTNNEQIKMRIMLHYITSGVDAGKAAPIITICT